jgi:hypothetical protein
MQCGIDPIAEERHPLHHENDLDAEPPFDRNTGHVENRLSLGRDSSGLHDRLGMGRRAYRRCHRYYRHDNQQLPP